MVSLLSCSDVSNHDELDLFSSQIKDHLHDTPLQPKIQLLIRHTPYFLPQRTPYILGSAQDKKRPGASLGSRPSLYLRVSYILRTIGMLSPKRLFFPSKAVELIEIAVNLP